MSFEKHFPKTMALLAGRGERIRKQYKEEMSLSQLDDWQGLRYFAGFVRQKIPNETALHEVAQWEWVHCSLEHGDFSLKLKLDPGQLALNPSYQILKIISDNVTLGREKGLYIFVFSPVSQTTVEKKLSPEEAVLLDLLGEDRKYSCSQLISMAVEITKRDAEDAEESTSLTAWHGRVLSLVAQGIILLSE